MTILKYNLIKLEKALVFQVTYMDEKYRERWTLFKGDLDVSSVEEPGFGMEVIFLPGRNINCDLNTCTYHFYSNEKRDEHYDKIHRTLKAWAESEKAKETETYNDIGGCFEV